MDLRSATRDVLTFVYLAGSLVASASIGLMAAGRSRGYTWSLALFLIPLYLLARWFWKEKDLKVQRAAFARTLLWLVPTGFVLDLLFANTFFRFPDHHATLAPCGQLALWERFPLCVPAVGGPLPVEEFVFYLSGFMVVLLAYIWADEYWLARYNVPDLEQAATKIDRILRFHPAALVLGGSLLLLALGLRKFLGDEDLAGWPGYATYLILIAIVPATGLYGSTKLFINWRAFIFVFLHILLISLLWEVTLALPYGWWDYEPAWMVGLHLSPWSDLPVEAAFVWLAVTFTTVITYEAMKIWQAGGEKARKAFLGQSGQQ